MSSSLVGDPRDRAFERLYERYVNEVYRYVLAMVRNPAEAEDVTQTTFLNAYRAMQAGAKPRRPHNWLIAIAHNTYRSSVRRAMRRPHEVPLGEDVLAVSDPEPPNLGELLRAIGRLPFNQRSALAMRELEGRTYPEIAETLGVTIPAVEALIARARRTLRMRVGTLRGLAALVAPRSLRKLWEKGEAAAGGALSAGVIAKATAVVLVGIAGFSSVEAGALRDNRTTRPVPARHGAVSSAVASPRFARAPQARALPASPRRARTFSSSGKGRPMPRSNAQTVAVARSAAARSVQPPTATAGANTTAGASARADAPVGEPVQQTVQQTVQPTQEAVAATVAASVPQAPPPPVETPDPPAAPSPPIPVGTPELPVTPPPLPPLPPLP
jgi:RNA polymerase sigma factor (sigma-70 family)